MLPAGILPAWVKIGRDVGNPNAGIVIERKNRLDERINEKMQVRGVWI